MGSPPTTLELEATASDSELQPTEPGSGGSGPDDGGVVVKQGGTESVEKFESFSSNDKAAVSGGGMEANGGVNGGLEENGSFSGGIEEDPDGIPAEITEEMGDDDEGHHEFSVGDFVWGKIKSHPWWPGQVFDPSDASEYALKLKPKERQLLVAYFGDGTFAWCYPSQLKPFEENFEEMLKQSSSKGFVNAVQQAVDEIGRLVGLKLSCGCVEKDFLSGVSQPVALNSGIKEGVLVPKGRTSLAPPSEPADLLAELKHFAQVTCVMSVLELAALKSYLSAFYCSKGGYKLPVFCEAQPIPGLEDDFKAVEVPSQGPFEDWLSSPTKSGQTDRNLLQSSPQTFDERQYQKRKQKSIADLLGGDDDLQANLKDGGEVTAKEGVTSGKPRQKKQKGSESQYGINLTPTSTHNRKSLSVENGCSGSKEETNKGRSSRRRKEYENIVMGSNDGETKEETNKGRSSRRRKKDVGVGIDNNDGETNEESNGRSSRRRKKDDSIDMDTNDDETKEETNKGQLSRRKKDESIGMESNGGETKEKTADNPVSRDGESRSAGLQSDMNDQIDNRSLPRERKKSRYLSPPFTNPDMAKRKRDMEIEALQLYNEAQSGEQMTVAAATLTGSPQMLNCSTETSQKKHAKELGLGREIDPKKANASTSLVVSEVRSAALKPSSPIKKKSFGSVRGFLSIFRDSVYCNGSNYELYNTEENACDSEAKQKKMKKSQEARSDKTAPKQAAETPSSKPGRPKPKNTVETPDLKTRRRRKPADIASPASLFVTFGPGSCLPTKADLIRIYSKFGELNEAETEMFYNNFCARVSFLRIADAEEALNHSQNDSPFGTSNVNFRLHNLSAASKTRELSEIPNSPPAKSRGKTKSQPAASQPSAVAEAASPVDFIKHKLEKMTSMLANSDGKVSAVTKSSLESEIKELLKTVSTMGETAA